MARVTFVKKAQKNQGKCRRCSKSIEIGDSYYWFANRIGRSSQRKVFCGEHRPKQSEITTSGKLSTLYAAQENLEEAIAGASCNEDIASALRDAAEEARQVAEEYRDSIQNMPDNLQQSSVADEMEEKASNCEDWGSSLDSAADEIDGLTEEEPEADDVCAACPHSFSEHTEGKCTADKCECDEYEPERDPLEDARSVADNACGELSL